MAEGIARLVCMAKVETDGIAVASVKHIIVLNAVRIGCDSTDIISSRCCAEVADSYIITSGNAAGLFALSGTERSGVVAVGDGNTTTASEIECATADA